MFSVSSLTSRLLSLTILFVGFAALLSPAAQALTADELAAKQAYVIDYDTGAVLLEKNSNERMPTSSMSKVMTMYVVFDALDKGRLRMDDKLPVSEKAWRMQGSKMFVAVGDQVRVEDLIRGVIIQSGNDAAIVLAEGLSGSEEAFATAMNEMAAELGMKDSHFINASGWPDPDHYSTAHDLAILARALIERFPNYYKFYSETEYSYNNIKQGNRNPLLYRNIGADGVKTGHTDQAGYGLIGSGTRDGRRVIFAMNGLESMQARADVGAKLMTWGLSGFINLSPYAGGRVVTEARVVLGEKASVPLKLGRTFNVTVPRVGGGQGIKLEAEFKEPLMAPLKIGDEVGMVRVQMAGTAEPITLPLVVAENIPQMGLIPRTFAKAIYSLTGRGLD